jgi:hypothetical protein
MKKAVILTKRHAKNRNEYMQEGMRYKDEMQVQSAQVSGQMRGVCKASREEG